MTLPANIRLNMSAPFPATVRGSGPIAVAKRNGLWTIALNFLGVGRIQNVADPDNSYILIWNALTGVFTQVPVSVVANERLERILTAPGPYAALPSDEVLIVKQLVAAPFIVTVDWSRRVKALRVVDGRGDAAVNNITVTPAAGQSQLASVNYSYVIDGNGGTITLTPLPDGSGAY